MSLKDTLDAARQEVADGGTIFSGKDAEAKDADADGATDATQRRAKGSAARAKPAREAGSSVRVVSSGGAKRKTSSNYISKPRSEMTKEERKAERSAERREEDKRMAARTALLNSYPEYQRSQKVWWVLLGVGLGLTVVAFLVNWLLQEQLAQQVGVTGLVVLAFAPLVLAYGCIIAAVIYDLRVGRPLRKRADAEIKGMTNKRMNALIRQEEERQAKKKAEKEAKKKARKEG